MLLHVPLVMLPHNPGPVEESELERMVGGMKSWKEYAAKPWQFLHEKYDAGVRYAAEIVKQLRQPKISFVAPAVIGAMTLGAYFVGSHEIWINYDQKGHSAYHTIRHEKNHAENPYRHPDPLENEYQNRKATEIETGDKSQTNGFQHYG